MTPAASTAAMPQAGGSQNTAATIAMTSSTSE
jgi:hypothetical protein